jgi:diguanylate cyclase (GGDEF)-like protein/PAS domain S-box-containing protein
MAATDLLNFVRFAGNARDVVVICDARGCIQAISQSARWILGYKQTEAIGRNVIEFLHPDDVGLAANLLLTAEEIAGTTVCVDVRVMHAKGHYVAFEILPFNLLATDGVIILTGRDVTERQQLEAERVVHQSRFQAVAQSAPVAIFLISALGECVFVNDQWTHLTGQELSEAAGPGWITVIHRKDQLKLAAIRDGLVGSGGTMELRLFGRGGRLLTVVGRWTAVDENGVVTGYVGTIEDVTERKALEARLSYQATHDALTGLPNRATLNDHLAKALHRSAHSGHQVGIMFCDLDRFKVVNDSLGHEAGDRLLISVSKRLLSMLGTSDLIARFGGDEFVVMYAGSEDEIRSAAQRLQEVFAQPFDVGTGRPYICTSSIGISVSQAESTPETMLRDADVAMYRAKESGRGRSQEFDERLRTRALDRLALESDLPLAIRHGELELLYQPILDAVSSELVSVEALVRWDHPMRGRLSPEVFIGLAEETGFILDIGDWVLERACIDLLPKDDVKLNVNLSAKQVHDEELVKRVAEILNRTGFPPSRLVLEITESALILDSDRASVTLTQLKALGLSIAIDDFGTGYSSLSYLSQFPVDALKVDRSFVTGLDLPSGDHEIVRAVIALAHALGLKATAEGVETHGQLVHLRSLGCDLVQGYLFDRPVSLDELFLTTSAR